MLYFVTFILASYFLCISEKDKCIGKVFLLLAILLPSFIAGLRDSTVGTDTSLYPTVVYDMASRAKSLNAAVEWNDGMVENLYVAIAYYCSRLINDFHFFLAVVNFITLGLFYCGGKIAKVNITLLFFLFFFMYYNTTLNAQRQAMALSATIICIGYMLRGKKSMVVLSFVLAYCLHHSALLFVGILALYWMIDKKPSLFSQKKIFCLVVLLTILVMVSFNFLLTYFGSMGIGEEKYLSRYGSSDEYGSNLPVSVLALNVYNMIVFWLISKRKNTAVFTIFGRYMTVIAVLLCFLGMISTFAVRICDYFTFVNMLLLALYLPKGKSFYKLLTVVFYVFYWIMTIMVANLGDTYPYSSKILESII